MADRPEAPIPQAAPGATLVALCAQFAAIEARLRAVTGDTPADDDERDRLGRLQGGLVQAIVGTRAANLPAAQARARSLIAWEPGSVASATGDAGRRILGALLRDLAGEEVVAAACTSWAAENNPPA